MDSIAEESSPPAVTVRSAPVRLLHAVTRASVRRPFTFLFGALVVTGLSVWLASGLEVRSSFEELLPEDVPSVARVKELIKRVGGDGSVFVMIESKRGPEGLDAAKKLAPVLVKDFLALGPQTIRSIEWNMNDVEAWYVDHWPMFASLEDLEKARDVVKKEVSKAKRKANPLLKLGGVDTETSTATAKAPDAEGTKTSTASSPWLDPKQKLPREEVLSRFARYEDGLFVHPDKRSLTLNVRPTGTSLGVKESRELLDTMQKVVDRHKAELDAGQLRVGFGGSFPLFIAEYEAVINDVLSTVGLCVGLVVLSLLLFFRDLRSSVSLSIAVLTGVAITFGITRLVIGYLNTQTAFLGSIVVGNGINYGLIYLARVRQLRLKGLPLEPACLEGATTALQGTLLASIATSVSFGTLIIAANRGFRHFGFIGGIGMFLCWLATFTLVPALLAIWERVHPMKAPPTRADREVEHHEHVPSMIRGLFTKPVWLVGLFSTLGVVSAVLFVVYIPRAIERNLQNLTNEPRGQQELRADNDRAGGGMGKSSAGAIALLPSREDADAYCAVVRERRLAEPRWKKVVQGCDTVSMVVPADQEKKLAVIKDIARRVSDTVLENLEPEQARRLREVREQLRAQRTLTIEEAPATLIDRFRERDGTVGRLAVVTAEPGAELELAPNLAAFVDAVRNVPVHGKLFDATGENVIFADLLENIQHEGPFTTLMSFVGVCILVVVFFRRLGPSLEVIGTLLVGVLMMCGVAALIDLKINFFNFIAFPTTFGIAVDYGANVLARVRERRGQVLESLVEVGPAVVLCSWTTIIGYGTLLFALNRALQSFGWYAIIGEFTTLLTALIMLPAVRLASKRAV